MENKNIDNPIEANKEKWRMLISYFRLNLK